MRTKDSPTLMTTSPSTGAMYDASRQGDNTCHLQGALSVSSSIPTDHPGLAPVGIRPVPDGGDLHDPPAVINDIENAIGAPSGGLGWGHRWVEGLPHSVGVI